MPYRKAAEMPDKCPGCACHFPPLSMWSRVAAWWKDFDGEPLIPFLMVAGIGAAIAGILLVGHYDDVRREHLQQFEFRCIQAGGKVEELPSHNRSYCQTDAGATELAP